MFEAVHRRSNSLKTFHLQGSDWRSFQYTWTIEVSAHGRRTKPKEWRAAIASKIEL